MRVLPVTADSASGSVVLRKSTEITSSRNAGSKTTFRFANFAIALNTVRLVAWLNTSESGSFTPSGSAKTRGREVARAVDERLELGLARARDGDLGAQLLSRLAQSGRHFAIRRVQLRRELELPEGLLMTIRGRQAAAPEKVFLGRPEARTIERGASLGIIGVFLQCLGVLDHRPVEVVGQLGAVAIAESRGRRTPARDERGERNRQDSGPAPTLRTSRVQHE